jgi:hypothetical protein
VNLKTLFVILFAISVAAQPVWANDFSTVINQTYTLTPTGADVTKNITITNQTDLLFPKGYTLFLYSDHLNDLQVTDQNNQSARFTQTPVAGSTKVDITFADPVVGINQSQTYRLEYRHPDARPYPDSPQYFIEKSIINKPDESIITTVIIPKNICSNPTVYPPSLNLTDQDTFTSLTYTQAELNRAVTILCQPQRFIDFTISYQLSNPTLTPVETQITLPPDTSHQRLIFNQIDPQPLRLNPDKDGNRIATYKLEPKQTIDVTVLASAVITNDSQLYQDKTVDLHSYTKDQPYWPSSNHQIKQQAKELGSAKAMFDFITTTASYNPDQFSKSDSRRGGIQIINNPEDLSGEDFTDAFITLCRANGIASRRIVSLVQINNQKLTPLEYPDDGIHVYPEWYDTDRQAWIAVDPFWQKTNPHHDYWPVTDQLRLTLAINGQSDSTPHPANRVTINDAASFEFPPPTIAASIQNSLISKLFPGKNNLIITNQGNYALYQQSFILTQPSQPPQTVSLHRLDINSQGIIPITSVSTTQLALETDYGTIPIQQSYSLISPTVAVTAVLVTIASIFAVIAGRLLVHRRKR